MILVSDIIDDAKEIFGDCATPSVYRRINDAIEMLANKGEWTPLVAYLDVVPSGEWLALPGDVETVMAALINGRPSLSRNELYRFHINGPGDFGGTLAHCSFAHEHQTASPVMVDLPEPSAIGATLDDPDDGAVEVWAYGYDSAGAWVQTNVSGVPVDGYKVPVGYPHPTIPVNAPEFARFTAIRKTVSLGRVFLHTSDWTVDGDTGYLLGDYLPRETVPTYRRMRIPCHATSARLFIRRKTWRVEFLTDWIPLHNRFALEMAMRAVKAYRDRETTLAMGYEANAARLLAEKEAVLSPPGPTPIQVSMEGGIAIREDRWYIE